MSVLLLPATAPSQSFSVTASIIDAMRLLKHFYVAIFVTTFMSRVR